MKSLDRNKNSLHFVFIQRVFLIDFINKEMYNRVKVDKRLEVHLWAVTARCAFPDTEAQIFAAHQRTLLLTGRSTR